MSHIYHGEQDGVQAVANVAIDVGCQYIGMQSVSALISMANHFKTGCIDPAASKGTIQKIQQFTGIVLAATAGEMLKGMNKRN